MLDLRPIKARLDAATSWTGSGDSESMHRLAAWDIAALVAEVERLRVENESLRQELSDAEEELDDFHRSNPFYKEKPDA